jgi:hypothetical protein
MNTENLNDWNVDKLDSNGPSSIILDLAKAQTNTVRFDISETTVNELLYPLDTVYLHELVARDDLSAAHYIEFFKDEYGLSDYGPLLDRISDKPWFMNLLLKILQNKLNHMNARLTYALAMGSELVDSVQPATQKDL